MISSLATAIIAAATRRNTRAGRGFSQPPSVSDTKLVVMPPSAVKISPRPTLRPDGLAVADDVVQPPHVEESNVEELWLVPGSIHAVPDTGAGVADPVTSEIRS